VRRCESCGQALPLSEEERVLRAKKAAQTRWTNQRARELAAAEAFKAAHAGDPPDGAPAEPVFEPVEDEPQLPLQAERPGDRELARVLMPDLEKTFDHPLERARAILDAAVEKTLLIPADQMPTPRRATEMVPDPVIPPPEDHLPDCDCRVCRGEI
jgi:hypothetical protein